MPLSCDILVDADIDVGDQRRYAALLEHASNSESILGMRDWQMTLRICDDQTIADLHLRFFADPTPTDVITFPTGDELGQDDAYLGDVVVSVETAASQAVEAGHSIDREVAFLALHGLLHLCGYDDTTDEQRAAMHERQYALLDAWEREQAKPW